MDIEVIKGDITVLEVDAIVNAANCTLLGGGGVDGAIHAVAGPTLLAECRKLSPGRTGEAYLTGAGRLPCRYVIHTPGPVWYGGSHDEERLLGNCYRNCLRIAAENDIASIAFPCISTGVYRFPPERAAAIAISCVKGHHGILPRKVIFCCFRQRDVDIYNQLLAVPE